MMKTKLTARMTTISRLSRILGVQGVDVRTDVDSKGRSNGLVRRSGTSREGGKLRLRRGGAGAGLEPAEHLDHKSIGPERYPQVLIDREPESFRHHADDRVSRRSKPNGAADRVGIAVEALLPEIVADDGHRVRVRPLIVIAPACGHGAASLGNRRNADALISTPRAGSVRPSAVVRWRLIGRAAPRCSMVRVLARQTATSCRERSSSARRSAFQTRMPTMRSASGTGRRGLIRSCMNSKYAAPAPMAIASADDRDDGEARRLQEHPRAKLQVHRPAGEPAERSRVALLFFGLLDAAERAPGCVSRLVSAHPLRDVLVFEQLQVRA